jgi:NADPH2:quinone reductase
MRAVSYARFGPADEVLELGDISTPSPAAGEVLVRLAYSGVNPSDAKARAGARPGVTKPAFERIIPHSDGSGVIEAVGDDVASSRIGERVWIWNGQWQRAFGTAAEYIALPSEQAVPLHQDVSFEIGATLGIPGLTAAHTVLGNGAVDGQTLLISGGAGAVGHNAVQLAKWAGARVIATCSPGSAGRVRAAGADHVLEYRSDTLAADIMEASGGHGIDRAVEVEFGENAALLAEVMRPHGVVAAYGSDKAMTPTLPFGPLMFKAITLDFVLVYILAQPQRDAAIGHLHAALADGGLTPTIGATYDMADCAAAQDAVMTPGRAGAVLLRTS